MSKRILVVDDVMANRMLATAMLRRAGWETAEAKDGRQALAMLEDDHGFSAVLLDISMPGLDGEEVCRRLRANPGTASLPLVAYTAHAMENERARFLAIGFNAVLIKPINYDALNAALAQAMAA